MDKTSVYELIQNFNLLTDKKELLNAETKELDLGFDERLLTFGRTSLQNSWPKNVPVYVTGTEPIDLIMCSPWMDLISERAKSIVEGFPLIDVEFLPVDTYDEFGNKYTRMNYWVLHVYNVIEDGLDWESTVWTKSTPPRKGENLLHVGIIKPALYLEKVQNQHLFRVEGFRGVYPGLYISSGLRRALRKEKCALGMDFTPIRTV